jgi:hypothetical protein
MLPRSKPPRSISIGGIPETNTKPPARTAAEIGTPRERLTLEIPGTSMTSRCMRYSFESNGDRRTETGAAIFSGP